MFGNPTDGVNPVTVPVVLMVYLKDISPLVNVLGLLNRILVVVLSHWMEPAGIVNTLGVGLTVTVAEIGRPTQNVVSGPVGMMVKVTITGASVVFVKVPGIWSPVAVPDIGNVVEMPAGALRVHAKVVPGTSLLVVNTMFVNATPGHSFCAAGVATAIGILFTVNRTVLVVFGFPWASVIIHL